MRFRLLLGLVIVLAGVIVCPKVLGAPPGPPSASGFLLEFPGDPTAYPPGKVVVRDPRLLDKLVIHVPLARALKVFTRVNAMAAGTIQTNRAVGDHLVVELDLQRHAGRYAFERGGNTLEVRVVPEQGTPLFASWAMVPSGEGPRIEPFASPAPGTSFAVNSLTLFGEFSGGQREEISDGKTTAARLVIATMMQGKDQMPPVALRSPKHAATSIAPETGARRILTGQAPSTPGVVEVGIELDQGHNQLELLVGDEKSGIIRYNLDVERIQPVAAEGFTGNKWAVIVGVSKYRYQENGLTNLRYAHRDALVLRDFLVSPQGGGFSPERVKVLLDEEATLQQIRTALFTFLARPGPDDFVLVYFSGHGAPDVNNLENNYLIAYDSKPTNLGGTGLPMWDVKNLLEFGIRARRAVVLADACHSGSAAHPEGAKGVVAMNFVNKYLESLAREEGRIVITASRADEWSLEGEQWGGGHGVFTFTLLEGLRGAADFDGDGVVTAGEILRHLQMTVPARTDGRQHPSFREEGFSDAFPLAVVHTRRIDGSTTNRGQ